MLALNALARRRCDGSDLRPRAARAILHPWKALLSWIEAMVIQAHFPILRGNIDAEIRVHGMRILRCALHTLVQLLVEYLLAVFARFFGVISRRCVVCRPEQRCANESSEKQDRREKNSNGAHKIDLPIDFSQAKKCCRAKTYDVALPAGDFRATKSRYFKQKQR